MNARAHGVNPWLVLVLVCFAQFMVILDATIVNVALPSIQADLGLSESSLQWIVNAYALLFGGFLLLGGRAGDLIGRKRVFLAGLVLFTAASFVCGIATGETMLIVSRGIQGLGAALVSPAALSIVTTTFREGPERTKALGVWAAIAVGGGAVGLVLGGFLVETLSWPWIFFVNIPVGIAAFFFSLRFVPESKDEHAHKSFDLAGATTVTAGLISLVYGIVRSAEAGWGSAEVLGLLGAAVALLGAFVAVEARAADPLVPLDLFRTRGLSVSTIALGLNGAAFLGMFFITALYLQQVHGDSALDAGVHFLPMGVAAIASAVVGAQLVTRVGTRAVYVAGSAIGVVGLLLLGRAGAGAGYGADLLPGLVVFGLGLPLVGVSNQIAAVAEVPHEQAGAASGIVTSAFQIGGAAGLALVTSAATSRVTDALAAGAAQPDALAAGFQRGMLVVAGLAVANLLIGAIRAPRITPDAALVAEAAAA